MEGAEDIFGIIQLMDKYEQDMIAKKGICLLAVIQFEDRMFVMNIGETYETYPDFLTLDSNSVEIKHGPEFPRKGTLILKHYKEGIYKPYGE